MLGATAPYLVGRLGGRPLAQRFGRRERIDSAESLFEDHGVPATFVAAFAPLPYPIFALATGVARQGYPVFLLGSVAGRGARFFGIALLLYLFGPALQGFLENHLGRATLALAALAVLAYVLVRYFGAHLERRGEDRRG